eukprot:scaffold13829_cov35-Tisochrysis_lutea.AAC.3
MPAISLQRNWPLLRVCGPPQFAVRVHCTTLVGALSSGYDPSLRPIGRVGPARGAAAVIVGEESIA